MLGKHHKKGQMIKTSYFDFLRARVDRGFKINQFLFWNKKSSLFRDIEILLTATLFAAMWCQKS